MVEKLKETLKQDSKKFATGRLTEFFNKYPHLNNVKPSYSIPLKDTIGKNLHDQMQHKRIQSYKK